jgi:hypothetical protein
VQMLDTQGIVSSLIYFAIIISALVIAWLNRRHRLSAVMLAYLTFYLVMCLLNANIDLPENIALFFLPVALILFENERVRMAAEPAVSAGLTNARRNRASAVPRANAAALSPRAMTTRQSGDNG